MKTSSIRWLFPSLFALQGQAKKTEEAIAKKFDLSKKTVLSFLNESIWEMIFANASVSIRFVERLYEKKHIVPFSWRNFDAQPALQRMRNQLCSRQMREVGISPWRSNKTWKTWKTYKLKPINKNQKNPTELWLQSMLTSASRGYSFEPMRW